MLKVCVRPLSLKKSLYPTKYTLLRNNLGNNGVLTKNDRDTNFSIF